MAGRYGYAAHNNINHMQGERKQRISLSRDDFPELYPSAAQKLAQMHANMDRQDALRQASKQAEQDRKASAKAKAEAKKATNNLKKQQRERYGFNQNSKPEAFRKETMFGKMFRKLRRKRSPKEMRNTGEIIQKAIKASKRDERRRRERENRRQASLTPATKRGLNPQTVGAMGATIAEHRKRTGQPLPTSALIKTVAPSSKRNTVAKKMNNVSMNLETSFPEVPTHKPKLSPSVNNSEKVAVAVGGRRRKTRKHHKKKTKRRKAKRKHRRTNKPKRKSKKKTRKRHNIHGGALADRAGAKEHCAQFEKTPYFEDCCQERSDTVENLEQTVANQREVNQRVIAEYNNMRQQFENAARWGQAMYNVAQQRAAQLRQFQQGEVKGGPENPENNNPFR